jgi:hypothetical protein
MTTDSPGQPPAIASPGRAPGGHGRRRNNWSARDQARDRLTALVTGEDGTPDGGLVRAVAALGLPQADRALAAQVIARATGARLHERDAGRGAGETG